MLLKIELSVSVEGCMVHCHDGKHGAGVGTFSEQVCADWPTEYAQRGGQQ